METVFSPFIKKLNKIDLERIGVRIVAENSDIIVEMVQRNQLGKGLDSKGELLVHPSKRNESSRIGIYEPSTEFYWQIKQPIKRKEKKKVTNAFYNFDWTGKTFDGMYVESLKNNEFSIFSKNGKAKELEQIYQTKLFDLTEKNNKEINEKIILPKIQEYILNNFFYKL